MSRVGRYFRVSGERGPREIEGVRRKKPYTVRPITRSSSISCPSISQHSLSNEIRACIRSDTLPFAVHREIELSLPSYLPVSFNKSKSWQHGRGSVRGEVLHGIKVALSRTKSSKRTTEKQGGCHHGLDNIMDDRHGCRLFGSLRPSSYLGRAESYLPA